MQIKIFDSFHPEHQQLYHEIITLMRSFSSTYPNNIKWFQETFLPGLEKKERMYIIARDEQRTLAGFALIKKTKDEKKICTLYVKPAFRKQGIGKQLIARSITELGCHPLITVSQRNLHLLSPLLQRNGFHISAAKRGVYRSDNTEYFFNDRQADAVREGLIPVLLNRMSQLRQK